MNKYKTKVKELTDTLEKKKQEIGTLKRQIERLEAKQRRDAGRPKTAGAEKPHAVELAIVPSKSMKPEKVLVSQPPTEAHPSDAHFLELAKKYKERLFIYQYN